MNSELALTRFRRMDDVIMGGNSKSEWSLIQLALAPPPPPIPANIPNPVMRHPNPIMRRPKPVMRRPNPVMRHPKPVMRQPEPATPEPRAVGRSFPSPSSS